MLIFYLGVLCIGMYLAVRMLLPEMLKPVVPSPARPARIKKNTPRPAVAQKPAEPEPPENETRMQRLERLLEEKNKNIGLLQTELKIFQSQIHSFDKIKSLLEEEIHRLREQNRIFRSELGIPATAPADAPAAEQKEDSIA